ncbi:MAG: hypothetical protein J6X86_00790 [Bacteroidales bacterium]|nr:hypothetical protein [Bacteroidales bacterium]
MATIDDKKIEEMPKKIGDNVQVKRWKKKVVLQMMPKDTETKRPEAVLQGPIKFSTLARLFSPMRTFIGVGFGQGENKAKPIHRAISANFHSAFNGEYPRFELDMSRVKVSHGPLPQPQEARIVQNVDNSVTISWTGVDKGLRVMAVLYNGERRESVMDLDTAAEVCEVTIVYPPEWKGDTVNAYLATVNVKRSLASDSVYAGTVTLMPENICEFDPQRLHKAHSRPKPKSHRKPKNPDVYGIKGKLGPVNFTSRDGNVYMRAMPRRSDKEPTEAQKANRGRFKLLNGFLSKVHAFVLVGFNSVAGETLHHAAAMSANLKTAVVGEWPDLKLDLTKVKLSQGPLAAPKEVKAVVRESGLEISWNTDDGESTDGLIMLLYDAEHDDTVMNTYGALRGDGNVRLDYPQGWKGTEGYLYLAFVNEEGTQASDSVCVGGIGL